MDSDSLSNLLALTAELKLRQLLKRFCEADLNIKLVFTSFKIKNMFSFKDRTPDALKIHGGLSIFFVRDVIPVILVKPVAIFLPGLKNIQ